ncbi:pimeloyl-ACP methyl ester carboxylesterase [Arthrobacter ginsengisoli]|uniref:Pimeloyl-ACP methyl ester carboxylesterase n=1 Tax=Arthrobacter ginsengisoli TaxID=1356565 RepID=A0ABU1UF67_9MICC|nr:alpha/beta hydrolase [Arthrobacter ginsengisoli]MDR7083755.1 pimeloyl-ACP methyl ester carboxylesterase [Arthrobacter ginsengisoli]
MKSARAEPARSRSVAIGMRAAGAMALAVVLASCSLFGGDSGAKTSSAPNPEIASAAPAELRSYYTQQVDWTPCETDFQCAKIKVPLDYSKPDGDSIEIAALKLSTKGTSQGSLLINPGGPGGSGYDFVRDAGATHFSEKLRANFDIVGFDPRGVQRSAAVTCLTDQERDASREKIYAMDTNAGLAETLADNKVIAAKCEEETGPVLGQIDTVSSAKDLDILRAALNDSKLNYMGFSYGTFLGSTYASLFPDTVGRMVLDGAMDPSLSYEELTSGQAKAFEKALRAYVERCLQTGGCPLSGSVDDGIRQIQDVIAAVEANPMRAKDGRLVSVSTLVTGMIVPLYNDDNWPLLTQALGAIMKNDASPFLRLADFNAQREPDGSYSSNSTFAFTAINCLDYPMVTDTAGMRADEQQLNAEAPILGKYFAYGGTNCKDWPYKNVRTPAPVEYTGSTDIVVVGTTGDPATPVEWASSLRKQLGQASLLTWEGEGHTAYGRSNDCIGNAVDGYLVDGKTPADNTVC